MNHQKNEIRITGIGGSPGICIGQAYLVDSEEISVSRKAVKTSQLNSEISRFKEALLKTREQIVVIKDKISKEMGTEHGEIFSAHLLVLEDTMLIEEVILRLKREKLNIEYIFLDVLKKYVTAFAKMDDEYLKDRISDINDVGKSAFRNSLGSRSPTGSGRGRCP